ncbi:MAG TPA: hypothetical protein VFV68_16480 [Agriterribacter sp.]|nr:hypothetical protein [Agriterribacter sp.]
MVKQFIAITFLLVFVAQTFSRAVIVMEYYANWSAYAEKCENKAVPAMHCNGKCQMAKQIKKEEKKDQQNPERKLEFKNEITLSSRSFFTTSVFGLQKSDRENYPDGISYATIKMPRFIFHPPGFFG